MGIFEGLLVDFLYIQKEDQCSGTASCATKHYSFWVIKSGNFSVLRSKKKCPINKRLTWIGRALRCRCEDTRNCRPSKTCRKRKLLDRFYLPGKKLKLKKKNMNWFQRMNNNWREKENLFAGKFHFSQGLRHQFLRFTGSESLGDGFDHDLTADVAAELDSHPSVHQVNQQVS